MRHHAATTLAVQPVSLNQLASLKGGVTETLFACVLCCCNRSMSDAGSTPWLAYSTPECVVGLIKWPLDCDPHSSMMGLIAHPGDIKGLVLSFDGRKLITLGEWW